mmetsp:Transcript_109802/g.321519  ORF Transcript_109802/g.321519 Transcript_109802/m.321519 type:complete len:582 (+) Transcript_109802:186-1931(+)
MARAGLVRGCALGPGLLSPVPGCGAAPEQAASGGLAQAIPLQLPWLYARTNDRDGRWWLGAAEAGVALLVTTGLHRARSNYRARHDCRTVMAARKMGALEMKRGLATIPVANVPEGERVPVREAHITELRQKQMKKLNSHLRNKWRRHGRKGVAPRIEFVPQPDNPWRDRYLLCGDCERRGDLNNLKPRKDCNCSTLLELDMTAPFSRDNVMATSCEIVQMIREDVRVIKDPAGNLKRVNGKDIPGSFPVQVCVSCRKTSLDEGRRFRMCATCKGASYCSDECFAKHRMQHRASCTIPQLPYREEWGIRKPLRKMRDEIYPVIHKWAIRESAKHRIAWLPPPDHQQKILGNADVKRPILPGFSGTRTLPMDPACREQVRGGKLSIVARTRRVRLQRSQFIPSDPDPVQLLNLGMTREEFLQKEAQVMASKALEDEQAASIVQSEADILHDADVREDPDERPVTLSADAVSRLEGAAEDASEEPVNPDVRPPWEVLEEEEAKKLGGRREWVKKRVQPKDMPADEEKKDGVVYRESYVREKAKRKGLRLSEEALQRLEEAAATGGGPIQIQDPKNPRYKHSMY